MSQRRALHLVVWLCDLAPGVSVIRRQEGKHLTSMPGSGWSCWSIYQWQEQTKPTTILSWSPQSHFHSVHLGPQQHVFIRQIKVKNKQTNKVKNHSTTAHDKASELPCLLHSSSTRGDKGNPDACCLLFSERRSALSTFKSNKKRYLSPYHCVFSPSSVGISLLHSCPPTQRTIQTPYSVFFVFTGFFFSFSTFSPNIKTTPETKQARCWNWKCFHICLFVCLFVVYHGLPSRSEPLVRLRGLRAFASEMHQKPGAPPPTIPPPSHPLSRRGVWTNWETEKGRDSRSEDLSLLWDYRSDSDKLTPQRLLKNTSSAVLDWLWTERMGILTTVIWIKYSWLF